MKFMRKNTKNITKSEKEAREMMIQLTLANAVKVGEKEFVHIPIDLLVIPNEYQREPSGKIKDIVENYDIRKLRIPIVSFRNGQFQLLDGQHRAKALKMMGYTTIVCELLRDLTIEQEAEIFVTQNENVTKISPKDKLKGNALRGDRYSIDFLSLLRKYNLSYEKREVCNFTALTRVESLWKIAGKEGVEYMIKVMLATHWAKEAQTFTSAICRLFEAVIKEYGYSKTERLTLFLEGIKSPKELETLAGRAYPTLSREKSISQYAVDMLKEV